MAKKTTKASPAKNATEKKVAKAAPAKKAPEKKVAKATPAKKAIEKKVAKAAPAPKATKAAPVKNSPVAKKAAPAPKAAPAKKVPEKKVAKAASAPKTIKATAAKKAPVKKSPTPKAMAVKPSVEKKVEPKKSEVEVKVEEARPKYPEIADRRLHQLSYQMEDLKVDAIVVTYLPNIRYLTNFSGSNATMFILKDSMHFFTDDRYEEQIKTELYDLPNFHTYITRDPWTTAKNEKIFKGVSTLGFEADRMAYSDAVNFRNLIRPVKFKPATKLVELYTQPKSPEELENIQKAGKMAEQVYEMMLNYIKPGVSEKDIATEISYQSRLLGSEGDPFDIIAVSGARGALVHGKPSDKKIKKGDIVLLDFGCIVNGFCSDITRTISVGKPTKEQKDMYTLLRKAQLEAIKIVRPGMNGKTVDEAARSIIDKAGYGKYFQHSLGHGVGLEVHEMPTITFRMDDQIVPEGVVLAIEPGIYLPDKFGMRVEDNIVVTRNGGEMLTNAPDKLVVI